MIWLLFAGKIKKLFGGPELLNFKIIPDNENGQMYKFMICGIILLLLAFGSLVCIAVVATVGGPAAAVAEGVAGSFVAPIVQAVQTISGK